MPTRATGPWKGGGVGRGWGGGGGGCGAGGGQKAEERERRKEQGRQAGGHRGRVRGHERTSCNKIEQIQMQPGRKGDETEREVRGMKRYGGTRGSGFRE